MTTKTKESKGPACACGRGDLYNELLEQKEDGGKEEAPPPNSQADSEKSAADAAGTGDTEPVHTKE